MSSFGKSPSKGRRAAPRTQAPLVIELSNSGGRHSATLREISRTGAKLVDGDLGHLETGDELEFRAGTVHALCAVVWSKGGECAIAFDTPISIAEVNRVRSLASFVVGVSKIGGGEPG